MSTKNILLMCVVILSLMSSCVPLICSSRHRIWFRNCTKDTLFIGSSYYDDIDSVNGILSPDKKIFNMDTLATSIMYETKWLTIRTIDFVEPDSVCSTDSNYLFNAHDSCYFFLIRWRDAKNSSWDEIRAKRLYRKKLIIRDSNGQFDRNVRYE